RAKGSDAGHNGLKNIQQLIGSNKYPRLRFGIGNDYSKGKQIDFVLQRWNSDELPAIQKKIETSVEIIQSFVFAGVQNTMSKYNSMKF
ncbi:MAG TPA: aminoacyl-tRNA hydrolase, partial [Chitinophagaceae bacterium]|nr:aminoacyl-tRNA hydrolase [Chitinophagaceae bacterium]